ncbi:hypothetical protein ACSBQY_10460, partial [Micrococcus lylae]|uniref:hypothetical protein n=1 Tax=Micrococcus lylae TaxID=1273 RepID=UPI003EC0D6A2
MFDSMSHRRTRAAHDRIRQLCAALNIDAPAATDPGQWTAIKEPTTAEIITAMGAAALKGKNPAQDAAVQTMLAARQIGEDHHLSAWREHVAAQQDEQAMKDADQQIKADVQDAFNEAVQVFEDTGDDLRHLDALGGEIDWRDAARIAEPMAAAVEAERRLKLATDLWWALHVTGRPGTPRDHFMAWTAPTALQLRSVELMENLHDWAKTPWKLWKAGVSLDLAEDRDHWQQRCRDTTAAFNAVPERVKDPWGRVGALADQADREIPPAPA